MIDQDHGFDGEELEREQPSGSTPDKAGKKERPPIPVEKVKLSAIRTDDTVLQFRLSASIDDLISSLKHQGQQVPVVLFGPKPPYGIADGFCRIAAATKLAWDSIDAFVHRDIDKKEALRISIANNVVGRKFSRLERAQAIAYAKIQGLSRREIADRFGLKERTVDRDLERLNLPQQFLDICDHRTVKLSHAKVLTDFQVTNPQEWRDIIQQEKLSVIALKRALARALGARGKPRRKTYLAKEKDRIRFFGGSISLKAPPEEKERLIGALKEVIDVLRKSM